MTSVSSFSRLVQLADNTARRLRRVGNVAALAALATLLAGAELRAQEASPQRTVDVGLYVSPPFVMRQDERFTGMAVELWEDLAGRLDIHSRYRVYPDFGSLVAAAAAGEVGVIVTNLTITRARARRIDFTQPWFDAGLKIMVSEEHGSGIGEIWAGLRESGHVKAYAWLAFVILLATVALTLFDRRFDKDFPRRWRDGLAESFHAVMTVATSRSAPSRKNLFGWIGRVWSALWLICGVAVVAYVTSSVTSVMTTLSLTNQINGPADLPGKSVGVFTGSVAEEFARRSGLRASAYADIDAAVKALRNGRIDAIVGDAPVLHYYAHTHPDASLSVVGPLFEPDKYGFGLSHRSELTRPLTVELLGAHEGDLVERLRIKYFGDTP